MPGMVSSYWLRRSGPCRQHTRISPSRSSAFSSASIRLGSNLVRPWIIRMDGSTPASW
jgi:hypothetical protein